MSIVLLRPLKQNEIKANQSNWIILLLFSNGERSLRMSRRINDQNHISITSAHLTPSLSRSGVSF